MSCRTKKLSNNHLVDGLKRERERERERERAFNSFLYMYAEDNELFILVHKSIQLLTANEIHKQFTIAGINDLIRVYL